MTSKEILGQLKVHVLLQQREHINYQSSEAAVTMLISKAMELDEPRVNALLYQLAQQRESLGLSEDFEEQWLQWLAMHACCAAS